MKKFYHMIAICIAALMILGVPMSVSAEEGRYDVEYVSVGLGTYADMGVYDPGTYIISSSNLSDAASNILDTMSFVCNIPFIDKILPGCQYVEWGERFLKIIPDARYCVRLTDVDTGEMVWEGELTSGQDELYLGDDHSCYRVEMKPTISGVYNFVFLAKKN